MQQKKMKHLVVAAALATALSVLGVAQAADLPLGMLQNHMNLVVSASDEEKTIEFYGTVLGLERLEDVKLSDDLNIIRFKSGETQIQFLINQQGHKGLPGGLGSARGIRLMAVVFPMAKKDAILERAKAHGYKPGNFTVKPTVAYGVVNDHDETQVELVFFPESRGPEMLEGFQIGLNVTDMDGMKTYLNDVMGYEELADEDIGGGRKKYNAQVGITRIKYFHFGEDVPNHSGTPSEIVGMSMIQHIVSDVDAVRKTITERGGTIHTEPIVIREFVKHMVVEGPDGILFQFIQLLQ
jgi:catechol 2,3-dioxygenase-like lactoylglutathione lyase family enzyme